MFLATLKTGIEARFRYRFGIADQNHNLKIYNYSFQIKARPLTTFPDGNGGFVPGAVILSQYFLDGYHANDLYHRYVRQTGSAGSVGDVHYLGLDRWPEDRGGDCLVMPDTLAPGVVVASPMRTTGLGGGWATPQARDTQFLADRLPPADSSTLPTAPDYKLTVIGSESVTVPAGTFTAWKCRVEWPGPWTPAASGEDGRFYPAQSHGLEYGYIWWAETSTWAAVVKRVWDQRYYYRENGIDKTNGWVDDGVGGCGLTELMLTPSVSSP